MEAVDARVNIVTEQDVRSTVVSIKQSEPSPFIEGDSEIYEFEIPESNHPVDITILERAEKNKRRISIRPSRLKALQELEKDLPAFIASALEDIKREKLAALHKKDKLDPKASALRAKRYMEAHRETVNARRREKRKQAASTHSTKPDISSESKIDHVEGGAVVSFGL